jgi:hypothetical protein
MTSPFSKPEIKELLYNVLSVNIDEEKIFKLREIEKKITTGGNRTEIMKGFGVISSLTGKKKVKWSRSSLSYTSQIKKDGILLYGLQTR